MPTAYIQSSPVGLLSSIRKKNVKTRKYEKGEGKHHRNDKIIYLQVEKLYLSKKQKYPISIPNL